MATKGVKPVELLSILKRSRTGWHYLEVRADIAKLFESDPRTRRVICTLNDVHSFQCALSPNKGLYTIAVNAGIRKKMSLAEGDEVAVRLEPDASKYGAPMPEELDEVLKQDEDGHRLFHNLSAGMQRSLIYLVASVKNSDRRIEMSLSVVDHLIKNGGKVIAAKLTEEMKRPILPL